MAEKLDSWRPYTLSILRIMTGLLLLQHGLIKIVSFPVPYQKPVPLFDLQWFAGMIELIGGVLIALGLLTRPTAFICCGFTAVAYFMAHAPRGFYPILNGGELAVLYTFVFLYFVFAGAGRWSLDAMRKGA